MTDGMVVNHDAAHQKDAIGRHIERIIANLQGLQGAKEHPECKYDIVSMEGWEWPQGVALFALYQYYLVSGDERVYEYIVEWFKRRFDEGLPEMNVNTTCPMLTLTYVYERDRNPDVGQRLNDWLEALLTRLPRTEEGGFQHMVSGVMNEGALWDDTLYMAVLFVARMGVLLKRDDLIQESIRQFLLHIKYLVDNKTGLFYHGWSFIGRHHFAGALWGRGNSWYTAGLVDYLSMVEIPEGVRMLLLSTLEQQAQALRRTQDESGLWHTLLDDPGSYLETSCSCAFAYGLLKAVRMGYLDDAYESVGLRAVQGILPLIQDGVVEGVSYGTPVFDTLDEYRRVKICPMPYGQSMALLMLAEALRHEK